MQRLQFWHKLFIRVYRKADNENETTQYYPNLDEFK